MGSGGFGVGVPPRTLPQNPTITLTLPLPLHHVARAQDRIDAAVLQILCVAIFPQRRVHAHLRAGAWRLDLPESEEGRWGGMQSLVYLTRPGAQPLYVDVFEAVSSGGATVEEGGGGDWVGGGDERSNAWGRTPSSHRRGDQIHNSSDRVDSLNDRISNSTDPINTSTRSSGPRSLLGTARLEVGHMSKNQLTPDTLWAPLEPCHEHVIKVECRLLPREEATVWRSAVVADGDPVEAVEGKCG